MEKVARLGLWLVGATGIAALVGWSAEIPVLTTVVPGYESMKPNTALALVVLASAALLLGRPTLSTSLGASVVVLGAVTLVEFGVSGSFGIDVLLPGTGLAEESGRMAPAAATGLSLLGLSVVAVNRGHAAMMRGLAMAAFCVGYVAVLGYVYGVGSLYTVGGHNSLALHTSLGLVILSLSLLLQDREHGLVGMLQGSGSAGRMMRPMVPFLLVGPPVLGWLHLRAEDLGVFDSRFGIGVLVMSMTFVGVGLTWLAAIQLHRFDGERERARLALIEANDSLEHTVTERTHDLRNTAERLETLIRIAPVGIMELNAEGGIEATNERWVVLTGLSPMESRGEGWAAAVHPDDLDRVRTGWEASVDAGTPYETRLRFVTPHGQVNWVQAYTEPIRSDGEIVGHLGTVTDVTALHLAQELAAAAQARFETAFDSSALGLAVVSPQGEVLEANPRLGDLLGRTIDTIAGHDAEDMFEASTRPDEVPWLAALLDGTITNHRLERELRRDDGARAWVDVKIARLTGGGQQGLLYELEDITARHLAEARVEHLSLHDPLTDLPNRVLLLDRLGQALQQAARHSRGVGVLFIDLDRFKVVNDTLGHHAGDEVLTQVAARLKRVARATDTVARLGGDEFVVVCTDVGSSRDVLEIAANMRIAIAKPIGIGDQTAVIDASVGIAFGVGRDDPERLLRDADQAMYLAKDRGRARYEVFDSDLRGRIQNRLDTELALRGAVERGEIETWYHPIVDLQQHDVVATEALARWRRPDRDVVLPAQFISLAEDVGLIKDIGQAVLTQACLAAAALDGNTAISVNVSAKQFVRHDFGAAVERALSLSGLSPDRLWLELTESAVVEALDSAARTFQNLRSKGVLLAIDDFGTGFSTFTHLRTFTVDLIKIDMSFIRDIERSDHDRAIVEGILRLADSLHLDVVAEGIETTSQRDLLLDLGCRFGQGYLFARPSPVAAPVTMFNKPLPQSRRTPSEADDVRGDESRGVEPGEAAKP